MGPRIASAVSIVLCTGLLGNAAFAFEAGEKWRSSNLPLPFRVNASGAPAGFADACRRAASTWTTQNRAAFGFSHAGSTSARSVDSADGVHAVYWQADGAGMDSSTLATTWTWTWGGTITHFDMVFNGRHRWSVNPGWSEFDVESVALHEFGHALGLGHSSRSGAVMAPRIANGQRLRALSEDDFAGLAYLYPRTDGGSTPTPPAAPVLLSPLGSTGDSTPTFSWRSVAGATSYQLRVDRASDGWRVVDAGGLTGTSATMSTPLPSTGTYRWWVRAVSGSTLGPWAEGSFSYAAEALGIPSPRSPIGSIDGTRPTFEWTAAGGAASYDLLVSESGGPAGVIDRTGLPGTAFTAPVALEPGRTYQWSVRSRSGTRVGAWSSPASFSIAVPAPAAPGGATPAGRIQGQPVFRWGPVGGATHYEIWVEDASTGTKALHAGGIVGSAHDPTEALTEGRVYYWWVRAWTNDVRGPWSSGLAFQIVPANAAVGLAPLGTISTTRPVFEWTPVQGATRYEVWVDQVDGTSGILRAGSVSGTRYAPGTSLPAGRTYRWWVRAWIGDTAGPWSGQEFQIPAGIAS